MKNNAVIYIVMVFVLIYGFVITFRSVRESAFLDKRDRINVVFYGEEAKLLSFGVEDNVNYIVSFSHEDKVAVPGGYNRYVVGSLGRLSDIEDNKDIMQRAFSSMISAHVDFYITPKKPEVYEKKDTDSPRYSRTEFVKQLFSQSYRTNARFFDKMYVAWLISKKRQSDFVVLRSISEPDDDGPPVYSERNFQKKYKGFFFHQSLREEGLEVQIQYSTFRSARTLSRVIEGQGIRIVDLSAIDEEIGDRCIVKHNFDNKTKTVNFIARRFNCSIEKGETEGVDVILFTGSELEAEWE